MPWIFPSIPHDGLRAWEQADRLWLIAEEVEQVYPDLVAHLAYGEVETVLSPRPFVISLGFSGGNGSPEPETDAERLARLRAC